MEVLRSQVFAAPCTEETSQGNFEVIRKYNEDQKGWAHRKLTKAEAKVFTKNYNAVPPVSNAVFGTLWVATKTTDEGTIVVIVDVDAQGCVQNILGPFPQDEAAKLLSNH